MSKYLFILFLVGSTVLFGQDGGSISYQYYQKKHSETKINFAVKGSKAALERHPGITYKYQTDTWHHIFTSPKIIGDLMELGVIKQVYFDPGKPVMLNDTMRIVQNVDSVHMGAAPLYQDFTGKDVIVGYIDSGLDLDHEDFQHADGSTRVLYYWDHSLGYNEDRTPAKYGYGQVWDSASINDGTCTSSDGNAHGTTVTGAGSGNGMATGTHRGVAPESDIIVVETNFGLANWTLSIADAVDFIFAMADSLNKPAVVNASLGTYLGSHDGKDPASQVIDGLLNEQPGRIMVAAAGNSGSQGKYHVQGLVDTDTSFTWMKVNPDAAFEVPACYFDLWADTSNFKDVSFAFGADQVSPAYTFKGRTDFYSIEGLLGTTTYDTIWVDGAMATPVEFYCEEVNGVYHIEMVMLDPDSADYFYRFETTGDGSYDMWSGAWLGGSDFVSEDLPDVVDFPAITFYHEPDSLTTIVSSWTCSPNVVTVGNFKTQHDYIDYEGEPFVLSGGPPGKLSPNSSKGPNRIGEIKPDISATGDGMLSSCPIWLSNSLVTSNPSMLAQGGRHVRNGGTSMASPVIAGIAALYLEKCPNATFNDFLEALQSGAYEDDFTGTTPNMAYGYGKVDAFKLLNSTNYEVTLIGDTLICEDPVNFSTSGGPYSTYEWFNDASSQVITLNETADVSAIVTNEQGCKGFSDTIQVIKGSIPLFPNINFIGGGLITVPADHYQWFFDGMPIDSSDSQYHNPDTTGYYSVEVFSKEGCSYLSNEVYVNHSQIVELQKNEFILLPNPFIDDFHIIKSDFIQVDLVVTDLSGKLVYSYEDIGEDNLFISVNMSTAESGVYLLTLFYDDSFKSFKLIKK